MDREERNEGEMIISKEIRQKLQDIVNSDCKQDDIFKLLYGYYRIKKNNYKGHSRFWSSLFSIKIKPCQKCKKTLIFYEGTYWCNTCKKSYDMDEIESEEEMSRKYFYGYEGQDEFSARSPQEAAENLFDDEMKIGEKIIIIALKPNRIIGERCCAFEESINWPDCIDCEDRENIGRSHICKFLSWSLIETGRKWEYVIGDEQEFDSSKLKKISGRKK